MRKFVQDLSKSFFLLSFLATGCGPKSSDDKNSQLENPVSIHIQGQSYLFENMALDYDKGEPCYLYQIQFLFDTTRNECIEVNIDREWESLGENSARLTWKLNTLEGAPYEQFEQILWQRWITDEVGKLYCSFYEGPIQNGNMIRDGLYYFLTRREATTVADLGISEPAFIGAAPDDAACEVLRKP